MKCVSSWYKNIADRRATKTGRCSGSEDVQTKASLRNLNRAIRHRKAGDEVTITNKLSFECLIKLCLSENFTEYFFLHFNNRVSEIRRNKWDTDSLWLFIIFMLLLLDCDAKNVHSPLTWWEWTLRGRTDLWSRTYGWWIMKTETRDNTLSPALVSSISNLF